MLVSANSYLADFGIPRNNESTLLGEDGPTEDPNARNDFIYLPKFRFRPKNDGLAIVSNLDLYFQSLYHYFYNRGLVPIICKGIVELVTLFVTLVISVFLFAYVDWEALSACTDETTCQQDLFDSYVIRSPFQTFSLWNSLVVLYCLIFLSYSGLASLTFIQTVQDAWNAKWVYEERLGISARKLLGGAVDWDKDVVSKLISLQQSGEYRIAIHNNGQGLNALVIANRILRKENFLVALFNRGLLDLRPPFAHALVDTCFCSTLEVRSYRPCTDQQPLTMLTKWSIYWCVLGFMFNHKYELRPAFFLDPGALRQRFRLCGIAHVVFMPFLLFFVTVYFGLQNAYDWKSTKEYLGPREWSQPAKWMFREFNELQHVFDRRLSPSYSAAEKYLSLFGSSEIIAAIGRIMVFIGGSFGAVLFAFAAMNDAILLHVKIANWNLLWFAGVFGVVYSAGKALIPKPEAQPTSARNLYAEINDALSGVANHTHYFPSTWKGRGWDQETNRAFNRLFQYKAKLFVSELLSLMFAPYILFFSLANCSEAICEFVVAVKADIPGAGDVCGYATFDFDTFNDEEWNEFGKSKDLLAGTLTESIMKSGNVEEARRSLPRPSAKLSKMRYSFDNFKVSFCQVCLTTPQFVI